MSRISLMIIAVTSMLVTAVAAREYSFPEDDSFDSKAIAVVTIDVPYGEIGIARSHTDKIDVHFKNMVEAGSQKEADHLNKESEFRAELRGDRLLISYEGPTSQGSLGDVINSALHGHRSYGAYPVLRVDIPDGQNVQIKSSSADIEASDVNGDFGVETSSSDIILENTKGMINVDNSSGDITVLGHSGPVSAKGSSSSIKISDVEGDVDSYTSSGDCHVGRVKGSLKAATMSGDNSIYDIEGDLDVSTASGDIIVKSVTGSVHAAAVSGDINLKGLSAMSGSFTVESVSGDIAVGVSREFQGELSIRTTSGEIQSHLPSEIESRSDSELTGSIGKGDGKLNVSSVSGDISVGRF